MKNTINVTELTYPDWLAIAGASSMPVEWAYFNFVHAYAHLRTLKKADWYEIGKSLNQDYFWVENQMKAYGCCSQQL